MSKIIIVTDSLGVSRIYSEEPIEFVVVDEDMLEYARTGDMDEEEQEDFTPIEGPYISEIGGLSQAYLDIPELEELMLHLTTNSPKE